MTLHVSDYSIISEYFNDKLDKKCSFIQDKVTMFLHIDQKLYKLPKIQDHLESTEELINKIIIIFEKEFNL